jgi:hypothetical protein
MAKGIEGNPDWLEKESPLLRNCTTTPSIHTPQIAEDPDPKEPWRSWPSVIRYVIFELARVMPAAALIWLAYIHR